MQRDLAGQLGDLVVDAQLHIVELHCADIELQRRAPCTACAPCAARATCTGVSGQQVVDIAHPFGIAGEVRSQAFGAHAVDDQTLLQQRPDLQRQGRLVERRKFGAARALGFRQADLGQLDCQARKDRKLDRPVDGQGALPLVFHPVDRQALVAVGVERGNEHARRHGQEQEQCGQGERDAANGP